MRVGHRQASNKKAQLLSDWAFFIQGKLSSPSLGLCRGRYLVTIRAIIDKN